MLYYNNGMVTGFPFSDEWRSRRMVRELFRVARWNQYVLNWPITLSALRRLWEIGKVSELKLGDYSELHKSDGSTYQNKAIVATFPFREEWVSHAIASRLVYASQWNQYVSNWSIALAAMRHLWEMGKVSELKSPFYELLEKPGKNLKTL